MNVHIGEVVSSVRAVDGDPALSPRAMEQIVRAVLRAVLREWGERIQSAQGDAAVLRLIESSPALRARLNQRRDAMRDRVAIALCERPDSGLDAFTADLLTGCAAVALDAANREWLRCDGATDRTDLIDRAFDVMAPAS